MKNLYFEGGAKAVQRRALEDSDSDTDNDDPCVELASSHSSDDDLSEQAAQSTNKHRVSRKFSFCKACFELVNFFLFL